MTDVERAAWAHPENPWMQNKWLDAIAHLRSRPRGYLMDKGSDAIKGLGVGTSKVEEAPPKFANRVRRIK